MFLRQGVESPIEVSKSVDAPIAVKSGSVVVFFSLKQTGPMPKKAFGTVVVLRTKPSHSIVFVLVSPAAVIEHPNGSVSVKVRVQMSIADDCAQELSVVVDSTVGVGVGHPYAAVRWLSTPLSIIITHN